VKAVINAASPEYVQALYEKAPVTLHRFNSRRADNGRANAKTSRGELP
jgi:hypothetical protein